MKLSRNIVILSVVFLTAGLVFGLAIKNFSAKPAFADAKRQTVLIDAGHGAPDGGAVGVSGVLEKDINLSIARKIGDVLEGKGIAVEYTRTGDSGLQDSEAATIRKMKVSDMKKRREIMNDSKASLFLSIHMNSFTNKSASGLHIFYSAKHEEIKPLAESIQQRIAETTGAETHAVKTASENLFLMKDPPLPCILAECGFISNPKEERLLSQEEYQSKIAWAIAEAVADFYETRGK